jgi:hypothetical protein
MKDDLSKYMPDVGKVLEESRPERIKARRRKAVEKLVDAGLIERETPPPAVEARVSAPSPWAKDGEGASAEIDKEELPSAMAPAAAPPAEERPVTKAAKPEAARQSLRASWRVVLACVGLLLAVMLTAVLVMVGRMKEAVSKAATTVAETAKPGTMATTPDDGVPSGAALPSPTAEATAMPAATATTTATPASRKLPVKRPGPKQEHVDPAPPTSAAPTAPRVLATAAPSTPPEPPPVPKIIE